VYARKPFEAYQHLLILKSCTDLQKFSPNHLRRIKERFLDPIDMAQSRISREIRLLYRLCKEIVLYGVFLSTSNGQNTDILDAVQRNRLEVVQEDDEESVQESPHRNRDDSKYRSEEAKKSSL